MTHFVFDLDGTLTRQETLPVIAARFGIKEQIAALTAATIAGTVPFAESFLRRVAILSALPVSSIRELLAEVPLYEQVVEFIGKHQERCLIATANLDCWVSGLARRIDCPWRTSSAYVVEDRVRSVATMLDKAEVVASLQNEGKRVVFIGDGHNDLQAMLLADIAIAAAVTHEPAAEILSCAEYRVDSEEAMCRLLYQLCD